jgi:hypothetical protein
LPFAALFAFVLLPGIVLGLANPAFLIGVFLLASVVIYTYCTFRFLLRGIDRQKICKPVLKDWIRISSFIGILFSLQTLSTIFLVINPQQIQEMLQQAYTQYPKEMQEVMSIAQFEKMTKIVMIFLFIYGIILLIHIFISRFYIRKYAHLFGE